MPERLQRIAARVGPPSDAAESSAEAVGETSEDENTRQGRECRSQRPRPRPGNCIATRISWRWSEAACSRCLRRSCRSSRRGRLLHRVLLDVAVAAEELHGERRDALGHSEAKSLAIAASLMNGRRRPSGARRCRPSGGPPRARSRLRRSGTAPPGTRRSALPNCFALLDVGDGVRRGRLGHAHHLRADADAPFVERLDGDLVALARVAEDVVLRDAASSNISSQVELARMPSLSSFLPTGNPGSRARPGTR